MSYTVEDLNPRNPILVLGKKSVELSLITLQKEVIFIEEYGSSIKIFDTLKKAPEKIVNVIWELVIDKGHFKKDLEVFTKFVISSETSIIERSKSMSIALHACISGSMPLIKNQKRYKDIQEISKTQTENTPCYTSYYDTIAKRYGYTIEQFYQLTLRQLHMLLKVSGDKSYDELEIQAALAGRKLKPRINFRDVSEEEEKEQEEQAVEALKRLQKEYQDKKDK